MAKIKLIPFIILCLITLSAYADIVIIANLSLPVKSLSREEIYRIYLGKTKFLADGVKVIPVDQSSGSLAREKFYSNVIQKSETDMKAYWSRIIFTGQGYPPIQESDDNAVKELVAKNPNCLGYIDRSSLDSSVKVVYAVP
jgi:ABC-type phosphate transport system substrate-binding protein